VSGGWGGAIAATPGTERFQRGAKMPRAAERNIETTRVMAVGYDGEQFISIEAIRVNRGNS